MRWIPYQSAISYADFKASLRRPVIKPDKEVLKDVYAIIGAQAVENGVKDGVI